jgi:hypothetical protein
MKFYKEVLLLDTMIVNHVHFKNLPKLVAEIEELKKQILNQKWK